MIKEIKDRNEWYYFGNRTEFYNEEDVLHKEDGPAILWEKGDKDWYLNGELIKSEDVLGNVYYYKNNKLHREDGPAIEWKNGDKSYFQNGLLHRIDGPAIEWHNEKKYYINGKWNE